MRSVSPACTGRPAASEKTVIATGPGSCITGRGSIPPQMGYDVKTEPHFGSVTSTESPPPWMCAARDDHAALGRDPIGVLRVRRAGAARSRNVEDRVGTTVPHVEPDGLDAGSGLADRVLHGV